MKWPLLPTLLGLFVLVLTVPGLAADENSCESQAIEKIELLGGKVTRDDSLPDHPVIRIDFGFSQKISDKYLHLLKSFRKLKTLDLYGIGITDAGLNEVHDLKSLIELSLYETCETPGGLLELQESLPKLRIIRLAVPVLKRQRNIAELRAMGFSVLTSNELSWLKDWIGEDLEAVFSSSLFIRSRGHEFTDEDLLHLAGLTNLKGLKVVNATRITDAGLAHLTGLTSLQQLELDGTRITDAGLAHLARLTNLEGLRLSGTQITDTGLVHLGKMTHLRGVMLVRTQVTDAGLAHLERLSNLRLLWLNETQVTPAGVATLKAALPGCKIGGP